MFQNSDLISEYVGSAKHIVINAKRDIVVGEDLYYDYKFPIEEDERREAMSWELQKVYEYVMIDGCKL